MAEFTSTRAELRRRIGLQLGLPFYTHYGENGLAITGTPTTVRIPCSSLYQTADRWNYAHVYIPSIDEHREITDFSSSGLQITYPFSEAPGSSDVLEIVSQWSIPEIHMAINRAIEYGRRHYPEVRQDSSIIITEDTIEYSLTSISDNIWFLVSVEMENTSSIIGCKAESGGSDTVVLPSSFGLTDDQYNGYHIAVYKGTGSGELGTVLDCVASTNTIQVSADWGTEPSDDSYIRIWTDAVNEQEVAWESIVNYKTDREEYPDIVRLMNDHEDNYGLRLRLTYVALPESSLSTETSTTSVPKEFITLKALGYLYEMKLSLSKGDESTYRRLSDRYHEQAEAYLESTSIRLPQMILRNSSKGSTSPSYFNPLGWNK